MGDREDLQWLVVGHRAPLRSRRLWSSVCIDRLAGGAALRGGGRRRRRDRSRHDAPAAARARYHRRGRRGGGRAVRSWRSFGQPAASRTHPASLAPQARLISRHGGLGGLGQPGPQPCAPARRRSRPCTASTSGRTGRSAPRAQPQLRRPDDLAERAVVDAVATSYDFSSPARTSSTSAAARVRCCAAVLRRNPHLTGGVLDQPHVVATEAPADLARPLDRARPARSSRRCRPPTATC